MAKKEVPVKRGRGRPRSERLSEAYELTEKLGIKRLYKTQEPGGRIENKPIPDTEKKKTAPPPNKYTEKYPPPRNSPVFQLMWAAYLPILAEKDNFEEWQLPQLEILCDLYVEYEELKAFIRTNGRTYEAFGRQGKVLRTYPEVSQLIKVQSEIRSFHRSLRLEVSKTSNFVAPPGEEDSWE